MLAVVAIFAWEKHYEREKNDKLHEFFTRKLLNGKRIIAYLRVILIMDMNENHRVLRYFCEILIKKNFFPSLNFGVICHH